MYVEGEPFLRLELTPAGLTLPVAVLQEVYLMVGALLPPSGSHQTVNDIAEVFEHSTITIGLTPEEINDFREVYKDADGHPAEEGWVPVAIWHSGDSSSCVQYLLYTTAPLPPTEPDFYWTEP